MSLSTLTLHRHVLAKDPSLPRTRYTSTSPIIPGALYLGDHKSILNPISLITNSIKHILSIRQSRAYLHERRLARCIQHEQIFLDDGEDIYLLDAVNFGVAFIEDALMEGGAVLVHCQEGRSRSASIVIAFLMKQYHMSFGEAWEYVRRRRPVAGPNPGFVKQLRLWERRGYR